MNKASLFIIATAVLSACSGTSGSYSEFKPIDQSGWRYGDTIAFAVATADSIPAPSDLAVAIRHNNDYEYSNLWLEVSYVTTDSVKHRDTLNLSLADVYGHWLGKGFGSSYQMDKKIASRPTIAPGSAIGVRHVMRVDTLRGIEEIGVTLQP